MLAKVKNKETESVITALIKQSKKLPDELYKSLTWDRGKELADHKHFTLKTDIKVYFCDPSSPWQRGSNENTNGLLSHPLVLILGGLRTGCDAAHQVPPQQQPIILAAISYPRHDKWVREGMKRFDVRQYQQTVRDTVPAVLLALDYLLTQESVDKHQVELVGVSLRAFLSVYRRR